MRGGGGPLAKICKYVVSTSETLPVEEIEFD